MYCPESFSLLRDVLEAIETGISKGELELSAELEDIAQSLGLVKAFALARDQTRTTRAMRRRIVDWFDAFRTLKFVHALRDRKMPIVPWRQAVERAPFLPDCDGSEPIAELRQHFFELEETRLPR